MSLSVLLPVELFAHILAFLRDDRPTLRSLSLSTRTLHALAYPLLFTARDFRALSHTHLRPFLVHLGELRVFWRPDMYGDRDAHVLASSLAPHLSPKYIPRLHTLALRGIGTDGMAYLNTLAPALGAFSALTTLSLTSTYHRHMRDVQSLLSPTTLPHLAHLHLHAVTWFMPDYNDCDHDDVHARTTGPALTSLRVSPVYPSCMRPLLTWLARTPTAHSLRALDIPPETRMGADVLHLFASSKSIRHLVAPLRGLQPETLAKYTHLETLALSVGMDDVLTRHDARLPDLLAAVAHNPHLRVIEVRLPYVAGSTYVGPSDALGRQHAPEHERTHDIFARVDRLLFEKDDDADGARFTALAELRVVLQSLPMRPLCDKDHGPEEILGRWSGRASLCRADACGRLSVRANGFGSGGDGCSW